MKAQYLKVFNSTELNIALLMAKAANTALSFKLEDNHILIRIYKSKPYVWSDFLGSDGYELLREHLDPETLYSWSLDKQGFYHFE